MNRMTWIRQFAAAALAAVAFVGTPAGAQETGTVQGTVTLIGEAGPVHGALVLLVGTGATALTDGGGRFEIDGVPAGSYEVLAQREHLTAGRQAIAVVTGEVVTVDFELAPSPVHEQVTVTASALGAETTFEAFNAVTTLDSFDIVRQGQVSLGDALRNEPGIASRSFGPGSSRPVIRGFDGDRVLILEDGVRTGDLSSQSGDHGVTLDPNGAERIEIVRGPATLLYGSNAVGGLVNVISPHESTRDSLFAGTRAQVSTDAGSANRQAGANVSVQHVQGSVRFWGAGSMRRTGDYDTPEGTIANSATELANARAGVGYDDDRFFASGGFAFEEGRYGVPFADEFHGHHDDEGEDHDEEGIEIDLSSRRRAGRFDVGLRNLTNPIIAGLRVSLSAIEWNHDELEVADGLEQIGTRFDNQTYIVRAEMNQRQTERLSGRFGAWTQLRGLEVTGFEALAPPTDQTSFAAFAYEELSLGRVRLQFGGRVERNGYRAGARAGGPEGDGHEDEHDDEVDDEADEEHDDEHGEREDGLALVAPVPRDRQFFGASASIGIHADLGMSSAFVANVTSSHRAPALEELYNFGPHVGNLAFEVGNPSLDGETTLGLDVSLRTRTGRVRSEFNAYVYGIDGFIFGDRTGALRDNLPVLDFVQGDSRFLGFDARGSLRLGGQTWATLGIGYVDAKLTATNEPLPRIPPLRGTLTLDVPYGGFTLSPELMYAARQDALFRGETETAGYSVLNVRASYTWPRQHAAHVVTFTGYNLTNTTYRNHSSFIKDLAPEMGRGIQVGYSVRFF